MSRHFKGGIAQCPLKYAADCNSVFCI